MRLTGDYQGLIKSQVGRQVVYSKVRFFADDPRTTTIRWYGVRPERDVLPFPSFVANEAWHNENGPFSGMLYGQHGTQGTQADPPVRYATVGVGSIRDNYNLTHLCGTADQWAGNLLVSNPDDTGPVNCCFPGMAFACGCGVAFATKPACACGSAVLLRLACACGSATVSQGETAFACACGTAIVSQGETAMFCACGSALLNRLACACGAAALGLAACACGAALLGPTGCGCGTATVTSGGGGGSLACSVTGQPSTIWMHVTPTMSGSAGPFSLGLSGGNWTLFGQMGSQPGTHLTLSCAGGGAGWHLDLLAFSGSPHFAADADAGSGSAPINTSWDHVDLTAWGGGSDSTITCNTSP